MISPTKKAVTRRAACIFTLCLSLFGFAIPNVRAQQPAPAQAKPPAPHLSVSVGLENNRLVLGQPIVLRYAIRSDNAYFSLPFEQPAPWMHVTLRDASGKTVAECGVESVRGAGSLRLIGWNQSALGFESYNRFGFAAGGAFVDRVFFGDQRLPVPAPGSYKLVVETTALWSDVPGTLVRGGRGTRGSIRTDYQRTLGQTGQAKSDPNALPQWASNISQPGQWDKFFPVARRFVFSLTVEHNPDRLTQIANVWREKLKTHAVYEVTTDPLLELFNLYGAPAEAVQSAVADEYTAQPTMDKNPFDLVNAVLRMGTPEAIGWALRYKTEHRVPADLDTAYYRADRSVQKTLLQQMRPYGLRLSQRLIMTED